MKDVDLSKISCPRCGEKQLITTTVDSHYRRVECMHCGWWTWLSHFKSKMAQIESKKE